jgi:predicted lipase
MRLIVRRVVTAAVGESVVFEMVERARLPHQSNRLFDVWHDGRHLSAKAFTQHDRPDAAAQEYRSLHIVEPLQIPPNLERVLAEIRESIARPGPTSLQRR